MWWAGSRPRGAGLSGGLDVYMGTRAFAVCRGDEKLVFEPVQGVDEGLAALQAWLEANPSKLALRFWLSGGLCRPFQLPPIPGVKGEAELQRIALSMASQHSGLAGECRLWLDRGGAGSSRVCVVVQAETVDRLLETARANNRKVQSIRPWWGEVLRHSLEQNPPPRAVATQDCDSLTVLSGAEGNFEVMTTMTPVIDRSAADAALARILMSTGLAGNGPMLARLAGTSPLSVNSRFGFALAAISELSA